MKTINQIARPSDLCSGEYAYPEANRRYYVKRLSNGDKCGVVSRMFSRDGNLYVDTMGGITCRVSGDNLKYQLCVE